MARPVERTEWLCCFHKPSLISSHLQEHVRCGASAASAVVSVVFSPGRSFVARRSVQVFPRGFVPFTWPVASPLGVLNSTTSNALRCSHNSTPPPTFSIVLAHSILPLTLPPSSTVVHQRFSPYRCLYITATCGTAILMPCCNTYPTPYHHIPSVHITSIAICPHRPVEAGGRLFYKSTVFTAERSALLFNAAKYRCCRGP